jgi:hypothetical protein
MSTTDLPLGHIGPNDPDHPDHPEFKERGDRPDTTDKGRKNLVLIVFAPNDPDPKRFRFDVDTLVGGAAKVAASKFGYDPDGTPSFRLSDGTVLDRSITLKAAGLKHRDEVELVDAGGGV